MSSFLVFLAIALAGGLAWYAVDVGRASSRAGAGPSTDRTAEADSGAEAGREAGAEAGRDSARPAPWTPRGLEEPPTGLPPVFLPEHPNPEDVDAVRFALAFRGYRMDQVDEVMARLRDRIGVQAALIEVLTAELKTARGSHSDQHPSTEH